MHCFLSASPCLCHFHCSDVSSTGCWLQRCPCHRCSPSECVSGQGSPMATQFLSSLYVLVSVLQRLKSLRRAPSLTRTNRVPNPQDIPKPISGSPLSRTVSPALPLAVSSLASFYHVFLELLQVSRASRASPVPQTCCSCSEMHHSVPCQAAVLTAGGCSAQHQAGLI